MEKKLVIISDTQNQQIYYDVFEAIGVNPDDVKYFNISEWKAEKKVVYNGKIKSLKEDLYRLNFTTSTILTMGSDATKIFESGKVDLKKNRGILKVANIGDKLIPFIQTYSEDYVDKFRNNVEEWALDILKAYNLANGVVDAVGNTKMVLVDTMDKVDELIDYVKQTGIASFDFENTKITNLGVNDPDFYATTLSFSFQFGSGWVIPLYHYDRVFTDNQIATIFEKLRVEVFENPEVRKIAQHLKWDAHVLNHYGIGKLRGRIDDTKLMMHLYNEVERRGLKDMVRVFFSEFAGYENATKGMKWHEIPLIVLAQYNATDTDLTLRLAVLLESYLQKDVRSYIIYRNLTMSAWRPLFNAEVMGMDIDKEFLAKAIKTVDKDISEQLEKLNSYKQVKRYKFALNKQKVDAELKSVYGKLKQRILDSEKMAKAKYEKAKVKKESWKDYYVVTKTEDLLKIKLQDLKTGKTVLFGEFNFGSPKQVSDLLFTSEFGFKLDSDDISTGKDNLESLDDDTGFVQDLLAYRSMGKMQSTYLRGIMDRLDEDGRVHTTFKIDGTSSGRLSSQNPNLQNIPNPYKLKDERLKNIVSYVKRSFTVPDGYTLIQADYAQAELRIIASFADETNMLEVYRTGGDLHSLTASKLIGVAYEYFIEHKHEYKLDRFKAKAVNFGFIYGISVWGFVEYARVNYGIVLTEDEGQEIRDMFFELYPKLLEYHDTYIQKGIKFGWVRTLFGRKRHLPNIEAFDNFTRGQDERVAINSPIQGTAGEFTIFAIALFWNRLPRRWKLVNTIHDSIMFYIPTDELERAVEYIKYTMENLPIKQYFGKELKLGMKVDVEASTENWASLEEI